MVDLSCVDASIAIQISSFVGVSSCELLNLALTCKSFGWRESTSTLDWSVVEEVARQAVYSRTSTNAERIPQYDSGTTTWLSILRRLEQADERAVSETREFLSESRKFAYVSVNANSRTSPRAGNNGLESMSRCPIHRIVTGVFDILTENRGPPPADGRRRRFESRQGSIFLCAGATIYLDDPDICYLSFHVSEANEACAKLLFVMFRGEEFLSSETVPPGCPKVVDGDDVTVSITNLSTTKSALVGYDMISSCSWE